MNTINWDSIGFEKSPFGVIPDIDSDNLIWAGFSENKKRFDSIISHCLENNSSNLILNLSRWGGGKTHSSYYYSKQSNLPTTSTKYTPPFSIIVTTPKEGNNSLNELYVKIIDLFQMNKIVDTIGVLKSDLKEHSLKTIQDWAQSEDLGKIIWLIADLDSDTSFGAEQLIYGGGTASLKKALYNFEWVT